MGVVVCTLFEGHYHHGVAALTNSLYHNGFRGSIFVGYRGALPKWANSAKENSSLNWEGSKTFTPVSGINMHFLPVNTEYHLTNYKPDFMLELLNGPAIGADGIFYFDPDIVVKCAWSFFSGWINFGVALVHEIVSNNMPENSPIRGLWKNIIEENNESINNRINSYINGGFLGLRKEHIHFLNMFLKFQHLASYRYKVDLHTFDMTNRADPFFANDQDVMNIAAMSTSSPLSEMGPEGMDFIHGGDVMSHATGSPKPWNKNFILSFLDGRPPSMPEKYFWKNVDGPIKVFSLQKIKSKKLVITILSFLSRFYKR